MEENKRPQKRALLWQPLPENKVQCRLCAFECTIAPDSVGRCHVRKNIDGVLYSLNYDKLCAANEDPIEKKPLFHFQPGSKSFSIAAPGCNFQCDFCQNWQISQSPYENRFDGTSYAPEQIVRTALASGCKSIAYTYTEPTVFFELCAETAILAKQNGLANVFVSNGFMSAQAVDYAKEWLDGINIDLKSFNPDFYKKLCKGRLEPVLDTIRYIANSTDIWMEITTLLVPGQNDSPSEIRQIAHFIAGQAGHDTPWHISRFYPQYKMTETQPTTPKSLQTAYDLGREAGLRYVYMGNVPGSRFESTYCHRCDALLIERCGYRVLRNNVLDFTCPACGAEVAGFDL